ncbi:MAG: agmatine deiminase family protein [Bacteroidales bacterium]
MHKRLVLLLLVILSLFCKSFSQPNNPFTPPEFFPSKAVLIEWPFNHSIWPLYSELISECQKSAEVILIVRDKDEEEQMRSLLQDDGVPLSNTSFVHVPCERMWIRDHGPLSIMTDDGVAFMDFDDLADSGPDEDLPTNLANIWDLESYMVDWILCGGNFMVDSYGTLFTTDRLYSNNPSISEATINETLSSYMGIEKIVTLSAMHDDYWGHIDMQMKLLNDTIMVISSVNDQSDPNFQILENNFNTINSLQAPNGKSYHIQRLPKADDWKTYTNSLILNNKVIVPVYDHPNDQVALDIYESLLPEHDVVGVNANSIIQWEGAIHCITMQLFDKSYLLETAINDISTSRLTAYPNPVSKNNSITLQLPEQPLNNAEILVYNLSGSQLETIKVPNGESLVTFIWNHPPGVYLVSLSRGESIFSTRVISF